MKKFILVSALALFFSVGLAGNVNAQADVSVTSSADVDVEAGLTPADSLYVFDVISESFGTFFTFGDVAKAERFLNLASERLAEARELANEEDSQRAEKATKKYEKHLSQALEKAEKANEEGKDVDAVLEKIAEATSRHQEVLAGVLEKVPETAKEAIRNAMERSQRGHDTAIEAVSKSRMEDSDDADDSDDVDDSDDDSNRNDDDSDDVDDDSNDVSRRPISDVRGSVGNVTTSAAGSQKRPVTASVAIEAEADVFTDITSVKVEIGDVKTSFTTNVKTRDEVITQIIERSPTLTRAQVEAALDFEVENRASRPGDLN